MQLTRVFELAFPGYSFECFLRVLDPILIIGTVRGKELHHLIGAIGDHVADGAGREIHRLADPKLVLFQRASLGHERHGFAPFQAALPDRGQYSAKTRNCRKNSSFRSGMFRSPDSDLFFRFFSSL